MCSVRIGILGEGDSRSFQVIDERCTEDLDNSGVSGSGKQSYRSDFAGVSKTS